MNGLTPHRALDIQPDQLKLTLANCLIQAIVSGNQRKVRHLLARGANVHAKNDLGLGVLVGALHVEDDAKRRRLFRLLLDHGAPYQIRDEHHQRTVLHWACLLERDEQVRVFLEEYGGNINLHDRDAEGHTALHHAVFCGSLPIVETLIEYHGRFGVSVDVEDNLGLTPYLHARRLGHKDVANLLSQKGQASVGHGDFLFRTPREWSQIGKFERRRAADIQAADTVNEARIWGRRNIGKPAEMFPQLTVTSKPGRSYLNRTCVSLPALSREAIRQDVVDTFSNTERTGWQGQENSSALPRYSFNARSKFESQSLNNHPSVSSSNIAGLSSSSNDNTDCVSSSDLSKASDKHLSPTTLSNKNSYSAHTIKENQESPLARKPYTMPNMAHTNEENHESHLARKPYTLPSAAHRLPRAARANHNATALSLLEKMPVRGRVPDHFHPSQFDKTKEKEYKTMLGNLTMIMDMLSEQQTKSFRKSVHVTQTGTQRAAKEKKKVSTFAILFSSEKGGRRRRSLARRSSIHSRKGRQCDERGSARGEGVTSSTTHGSRERSSLKRDKSARKTSPRGDSFAAAAKDEHLNNISEEETVPVPTIRIN
ncbi:unnamed protein product [Lymnaea stagnalis]|uniref:Uncharacterized protein n=1 Tax=Lymnaea stagnalis TaxID=6523 RepID=A0AAV2HDA5_LYMST